MLKRLESPCLNFNSPFIFGFTLGAISTFLAERKGYTGYEWEKEFAKKNTPFLKKKHFPTACLTFWPPALGRLTTWKLKGRDRKMGIRCKLGPWFHCIPVHPTASRLKRIFCSVASAPGMVLLNRPDGWLESGWNCKILILNWGVSVSEQAEKQKTQWRLKVTISVDRLWDAKQN